MTAAADRQIEALRAAGAALDTEEAQAALAKGLTVKHPRVVATAAKILRDASADVRARFEDDLVQALHHWLLEARRQDPGCLAKIALVEALVRREEARLGGVTPGRVRELLRRGARHVQWEKVFGGQVDVAGDLRIASAAGLITVGDPTALVTLTDHLADPLSPVRRAAALNLRAHGGGEAALLLRLRARMGDAEPDVLGDVLRALLSLDPDAVDVAAAWLRAPAQEEDAEAIFAEAALALGELASTQAFDVLRHVWAVELGDEHRRVLVAAIAQIRSEDALRFLIDVVRDAKGNLAADAAALLAPALREGELRDAFREAVRIRDDPRVLRAARIE